MLEMVLGPDESDESYDYDCPVCDKRIVVKGSCYPCLWECSYCHSNVKTQRAFLESKTAQNVEDTRMKEKSEGKPIRICTYCNFITDESDPSVGIYGATGCGLEIEWTLMEELGKIGSECGTKEDCPAFILRDMSQDCYG